ncbi:MAG: hypothetical protein JXR65_07830 [Bacteroidales bacterium]|nr:hypothetical protein [Bacteroidales bacterium]
MKPSKSIFSITLALFCLLFVQTAFSQEKNEHRYEMMLNENMLADSLKNVSFGYTLDVSPNQLITLAEGNKIFLLGWGGIAQLGENADSTIASFAYTSDGLLMAVLKNRLCYMDTIGVFSPIAQLPTSYMGLAPGKNVIYLFDRVRTYSTYRLFVLAKGGKYKQLLITPEPITSLTEMGDSVYFAVGSAVFSFSPDDLKLNLVAGLQKDNAIVSITADTVRNILYLSTSDAIYAKQGNSMVYVTGDFGGGIVKYFGNGLILFNPETHNIIRIVNIDKSIEF